MSRPQKKQQKNTTAIFEKEETKQSIITRHNEKKNSKKKRPGSGAPQRPASLKRMQEVEPGRREASRLQLREELFFEKSAEWDVALGPVRVALLVPWMTVLRVDLCRSFWAGASYLKRMGQTAL